jgi:DNA-binding transcriptional LysR family regulator
MAMDLRQMKYFTEVYETRSFSRAAHNINISQPGLSKSIRLLEEYLCVKLFERTASGVSPTVFGESLYMHAKSINAELSRAQSDIQTLNGSTQKSVSVGVLPSHAITIIPEASLNLTNSHPGIRLQVVEKPRVDMIPALRRGEFDFAVSVLTGDEPETGILQRELFQDRPSIIVRSSHPLFAMSSRGITELLQYPWVLPRDGADHLLHMEEYFRTFDAILPQAIIESQSVAYLKSVVMHSDYIGILPNDTPCVEEREGLLRRLTLTGQPRKRIIGILYREDHPLSRASRYFIKEILSARKVLAEQGELATGLY